MLTHVTAAITTYNRAELLPDAIESALAQTYADVEVLVVDDGSTDASEGVLNGYGSRIRVVRQPNLGRAEARNTAVREARGRLISFLDSDDMWLPDKLEREVPVLEADERAALVHGHVEAVGPGGDLLAQETARLRKLVARAHGDQVTYAGYALESRCFSSAVTARVEAIRSVGMYDPALRLDDYDLYLRLLSGWKILFVGGAAVARYRLHPGQMSSDDLTYGQIQTAEKHLALLDRQPDLPDAKRARANFLLMLARSWATLGDRRRSRRYLVDAVRADTAVLARPPVLRALLAATLRR